jgi:cyclic-di-GMP-binding biofilm dispersal mediator protein
VNVFPGHTETGLADRAIAGTAPQFPQGMTTEHVAERIIKALVEDEKTVASSDF